MFNKEVDSKQVTLLKRFYGRDNYLVLDETNAIAIEKGENNTILKKHVRLESDELKTINSWKVNDFTPDQINKNKNLDYVNLYIDSDNQDYDAIYDYHEDRFTVEKGLYEEISSVYPIESKENEDKKENYVYKYGCFLATFTIKTDKAKDDLIEYMNCISKSDYVEKFDLSEKYFVLVNLDGTIRDGKVFKSEDNHFEFISEIIDLSQYGSLNKFKKIRKQELEDLKQENIIKFRQRMAEREDSPYYDMQVAKLLRRRI